MKKYLVLLLAFAAIVLSSCSKDDKNDATDLSGTTWGVSETSTNYSWEESIEFTSASSFTYSYEETDNGFTESESVSGTYTYKAPKVTGKITFQGKTALLEGTIEGNQLKVYIDGQYYETYTQQ